MASPAKAMWVVRWPNTSIGVLSWYSTMNRFACGCGRQPSETAASGSAWTGTRPMKASYVARHSMRAGRSGATASCAAVVADVADRARAEEHTSELQARENLVCRLLLE